MLQYLSIVVVSMLMALSSVAYAEDTVRKAPEGPGRFSFGGGLGTTLYSADYGTGGTGLGGLGNLAALQLNAGAPVGAALVEAAVVPALRLGLNVTGSYNKQSADDQPLAAGLSTPSDSKAGSAGGAISARWVLNPGERVEFSPLVSLGGQWSKRTGQVGGNTYDSDGVVTGFTTAKTSGKTLVARLAFVLEYQLLPRLFLRLETHFAQFSYGTSETHLRVHRLGQRTEKTKSSFDTTSLGVGFQPFLQLRIVM